MNRGEDFVVTFYNGEYPELYPKELKIIKFSSKTRFGYFFYYVIKIKY